MSARPADVQSGRARAALEDLVRSECNREVSPEFLKWIAGLVSLRSVPSLLGDRADFFDRPSGSGGPLEFEVLCALDLMNEQGARAEPLLRKAIDSLGQSVLDRLDSYIRAVEADADADRSVEVRRGIKRMREDSRRFDSGSFARGYLLESHRESRPERPQLSTDEDLTGHVSTLVDNHE